jgi:hypothetical protein
MLLYMGWKRGFSLESIYGSIQSELPSFKQPYILAPELWQKFHIDGLTGFDFSKWKRVRMMEEDGSLSDETKEIPSIYGGIYIYCILPGIIPECGVYVMYIGKASKTISENLRSRVRSYKAQFGEAYTRDRVHNLFARWGKYVYAYYLPVKSDSETIEELETRLIACFVPPCNADIRDPVVKRAVKAFGSF